MNGRQHASVAHHNSTKRLFVHILGHFSSAARRCQPPLRVSGDRWKRNYLCALCLLNGISHSLFYECNSHFLGFHTLVTLVFSFLSLSWGRRKQRDFNQFMYRLFDALLVLPPAIIKRGNSDKKEKFILHSNT